MDHPYFQRYLLSVDAPLVGGETRIGTTVWPANYRLATYVDTGSAEDVWITLPPFTVIGAPVSLEPLRFRRRWMLLVALINC